MKKYLVTAAVAVVFMAPGAALAQAVPPAVVAVVDLEKVSSDCNACKTAQAALQAQITSLQNREKTLSAPLETEGKAIQAAVNALNGKDPDAALQARMKAWQTKRDQGAQEISTQQQQIQRNQQYIQQQIAQKLGPIYQQVMQKRGANILVEMGTTLATAQSVDVSGDVVAALNTALPSIATTAPATTQKNQPQGR